MRLTADLVNVDAVCDRVLAKKRGYIPQKPTPKQIEFLAMDNEIEVMFGGAGGGGKSSALLMAALKYVHVPGYSALILRRTYKDLNLSGAIMDRAHDWLKNTDAKWNAQDHRYRFPSGASLTFGHLHHETDKTNYKSAEFQFIGFDEVTEFPELWYTFLFTRLRKTKDIDVPLRMRSATNPGGIGHVWVYDRFVNEKTRQAPFVPSFLSDNPHIDDTYLEALDKTDQLTRDQVKHGLWNIDSSLLVYNINPERNFIHSPVKCTIHILGIDYGATNDSCSFTVVGLSPGSPVVTILKSYKKKNMAPGDAAEEAQRLDREYHFARIVGDANGLGKGYMLEARRRFGIPVEDADKANKAGYIKLFNGDLEKGLIKIVEPDCTDLVKESIGLVWSDASRSKEMPNIHNDCLDGGLYAWRLSHQYLRQRAETSFVPIKSTMQKW